MQVRYRYRIYPSPGQQQALARAFGCARVVYNDCLRVRDEAYAAGEKISDTEVQRRVITLAKATPERAWLGRGRVGGSGPGVPGPAARLQELVRLAQRPPEGAKDQAPEAQAKAGPPVHPPHPQRVRPAQGAAVRGQGRGHQGRMVQGAAVHAVVGHGDP